MLPQQGVASAECSEALCIVFSVALATHTGTLGGVRSQVKAITVQSFTEPGVWLPIRTSGGAYHQRCEGQ